MRTAFLFPGQGSQFSGMGKELYAESDIARGYFDLANDILGFKITDIMFEGSDEELRRTDVTQPAVFVHSMAKFFSLDGKQMDMCAGHSLGEFSALVAAGVLDFTDGLELVKLRALAMQRACAATESTMAAVLGMEDEAVEKICASITDEVVVAANYNSPGQLVISGTILGIDTATKKLLEAGCKRVVKLPVGGAFHSPLMSPARIELEEAIQKIVFNHAKCPVYQNVNALPVISADEIKKNLISQLTAPVRWTQTIQKMIEDGASQFVEVGPGKVLQGLVKKIDRTSVIIDN